MYKALFLISGILVLSCSQLSNENKNVQLLQTIDGKITIFDAKTKQLITVGASNRIIDVVDLKLTPNQISTIKAIKDSNDNKIKVNDWEKRHIPKEKYTVALSTRFYKDQCLYKISVKPVDKRLLNKEFYLRSLKLYDKSKFTLEELTISPSEWITYVDSSGIPDVYQCDGKIAMTLDNYMEINGWSCSWWSDQQ